jgi:hypothetical protein
LRGKRKFYEVVARPITKIMCHCLRVPIFFPLYCPENLAGSAATGYYSSQDCGKPVNTSSVLLEFVHGMGCKKVYKLRYG